MKSIHVVAGVAGFAGLVLGFLIQRGTLTKEDVAEVLAAIAESALELKKGVDAL